MVIVPKPDGSIRLMMDPRDLNEYVKRPHHAVQTFDEVVSQLSNWKYFSVLDQKLGYWQVQMDDQLADICTFITPHGRYQYTGLPMGLASAHDIFQSQSDQTFSNIPHVYCITDDILITVPNQK